MRRTLLASFAVLALGGTAQAKPKMYQTLVDAKTCHQVNDIDTDKNLSREAILEYQRADFNWIKGYLSGRNMERDYAGQDVRDIDIPGAGDSWKTRAFLISYCHFNPESYLFIAADELFRSYPLVSGAAGGGHMK